MTINNIDLDALLEGLDAKDLDKEKEFVVNSLKAKLIEDILRAMEEENISRSALADKLNKSKQYVSRILNETANFTLETLAEISIALDRNVSVRIVKTQQTSYFSTEYSSRRLSQDFSPQIENNMRIVA